MRKIIILVLVLFFAHALQAQNRLLDSLKQQLAVAKEDTNKVRLLNDISTKYTWMYADTASMYARRGLQLAQRLNDEKGIAFAQRSMCASLTVLGNYLLALDYGFKALTLFKKIRSNTGIAGSYNTIAQCYRGQGDYSTAIKYARIALQLAEQNQFEKKRLAIFQGILSSTYEKDNQLDSAIKYGERAYEVNKQWSGILYVLGNAYAKKGNFNKAKEYFQKAIPIAEKNETTIDLADVNNAMANMYKSKDQADSAIYYATKTVQQKWAHPSGVLQASNLLAELYESQNEQDSAFKYFKLSAAFNDSLFNQEKTRAFQNLAFNEQFNKQEKAAVQEQYKNKVRIFTLAGGSIALLSLALILYRNNLNKQKAYALLQKQKQETDLQRTKAEDALQELQITQTQLVQREKMASLGELTAGIAHEIQNPLNFVNNFSEMNMELIEEMKTELANGNGQEAMLIADDIKENEQKINHHGKRADAIVKGMLQHSRSSTGKKELTDINVLAGEYLPLSYHGLRAKDKSFNTELVTNFDKNLPKINVVQQDIGRVLLNLFNNAFYAVQEKRKAESEKLKEDYKPTVEVSTSANDGFVVISVKDNGCGIPDGIKEKIMQPFFTTKPTGEGTGLGLSISYDIVKAHGGELRVETKEGESSHFIIVLPLNPSS